MELTLTDQERELRDEVRDFLAANAPAPRRDPGRLRRADRTSSAPGSGSCTRPGWSAFLAARVRRPRRRVMEQIVVNQEMARAGRAGAVGASASTSSAPR